MPQVPNVDVVAIFKRQTGHTLIAKPTNVVSTDMKKTKKDTTNNAPSNSK